MPSYAFGPFVLDTSKRLLTRAGERVPIGDMAAEILRLLVEAKGAAVERKALLAQLWGDVAADERTLAAEISALGAVLNGDGASHIETVPGVGYRLAVPVKALAPPWWNENAARPRRQRSRRRLAVTILALVLLVGAGLYRFVVARAEGRQPAPVALAVLPFASADLPDSVGALGIGLADGVIGQLGGQPRITVRPMSRVIGLADEGDPVAAGRSLGVDHVLVGEVRRVAGRFLLSVHLTDVATGKRRWSERFDETTDGLFPLQEAIAARVARSLMPWFVSVDETTLKAHPPKVAGAYLRQIEGRAHFARAEREPAVERFRQAIALDPDYALAYAGLASAYGMLSSEDGRPLARSAAERAVALDPRIGEAHAVLGDLAFFHDWNWRAAETAYQKAVAVGPTSAEAAAAYGWFLAAMGRHVDALVELGRAHRLDPTRRQTLEHLGVVRWIAGQPEPALAALAEASAIDPTARRPHLSRMLVLDQLGRFDEAMAARLTWLALVDDGAFGETVARLHTSAGYAAAMAEWIRYLDRLDASYEAALEWMAIGERDRALAALERCLDARCPSAPFLLQHPPFLPLHATPRFRALAQRLRLPLKPDALP